MYAPEAIRGKFITWVHTSIAMDHSILELSKWHNYWLIIIGIQVSMLMCRTLWHPILCAQSKTPRQFPAGKLQSLLIPQGPWTHLSVDFITYLSESKGNTTILVAVDWVSEAFCLILFVFCLFSLLEDRGLSDWGSQVTSHVWKAFMEKLSINIRLITGYHPESNS